MNVWLKKLLALNKTLLVVTLLLAVAGVVSIYSATYMREGRWEDLTQLWRKQSLWVLVGLVVHFVAALVDYRWVREMHGGVVIYVAGLILLIATAVFAEERSGARSWLDLGPVDLQTSQVAVLGGIMVLAVFLADFKDWHSILRILVAGALVGGPFLLILIQPDLGSAMVWVPIVFAMLWMGDVHKRYLIALLIAGIGIAAPLAYFFVLKDYQVARLLVFLDPENPIYRQDEGWGIYNSLVAIGSGGLQGKGFLAETTQNHLGFLPIPTAPTDYIFAVLAEEHGFRGAAILIAAFTILLLMALHISNSAVDNLGLLLGTGITALLFTHAFLNMGMTISLVPITGLPLPLLSYGGSFAVLILFCLGVLQSIWVHRRELR